MTDLEAAIVEILEI